MTPNEVTINLNTVVQVITIPFGLFCCILGLPEREEERGGFSFISAWLVFGWRRRVGFGRDGFCLYSGFLAC